MKKALFLFVLALMLCQCGNQQPKNNDTPEVVAPVKSNKETCPEKFKGAYIMEKAQSVLEDVTEPKEVKSIGVIGDSLAKVRINYLNNDHSMVLKFVNGDWVLSELDGVAYSN